MTPEDKKAIIEYFDKYGVTQFELEDDRLYCNWIGSPKHVFPSRIYELKDNVYDIISNTIFFWLPEKLGIKMGRGPFFCYEGTKVTKENYQEINRKIQKKYNKMEDILGQSFGEFIIKRIEDEGL